MTKKKVFQMNVILTYNDEYTTEEELVQSALELEQELNNSNLLASVHKVATRFHLQ